MKNLHALSLNDVGTQHKDFDYNKQLWPQKSLQTNNLAQETSQLDTNEWTYFRVHMK